MPRAPGKKAVAAEKRRLADRISALRAQHDGGPTAETWCELGSLLARAYDISREFANELRNAIHPGSDAATLNPLTCWEKAVKLAPDHVEAWFLLGRKHAELDHRDAARACLTKVVALDPRRAEAWAILGDLAIPPAEETCAQALAEAELSFLRAVDADPEQATDLGVYAEFAEAALYLALKWYATGVKAGDSSGRCAKGVRRVKRALAP